MNDWVVETPSFEEDLMNNRVVMLNQVGVNRVVEIIKEKDKEIERLNKIIEIKNNRIQQLMKRTRSARIDKAIEYIEEKEETLLNCDEGWLDHDEMIDKKRFETILEILKGEDKE